MKASLKTLLGLLGQLPIEARHLEIVRGCTDPAQLDAWLAAAVKASSVGEVLGED